MKISACIVVYNKAEEALRTAALVLAHTRRWPITLYLVDNASPDGSGALLRERAQPLPLGPGQRVEVICREANDGFGTGHNTVLPLIDSDVHFILNPDIQIEDDVLCGMADWLAAHPQAVMARPAVCYPDGNPQELPLRKCSALALVYRQLTFIKPLKRFNDHYVMNDEDLSGPTEIEFCTGCFSAVKTADWKSVGGFDENYFMYVEDADLTQKMRQRGLVYLLPQFKAYHVWNRAPHRDVKQFFLQMKSMSRYFSKWGFRF